MRQGKAHGGDGGERLPAEAPDTAGVSEDMLFLEEAVQPLEGVCYGFFYINHGFV
jgi:hypothetical protein